MNAKDKNRIYWNILTNKFYLDLETNYFELNDNELTIVDNLSQAFNIKPRNGWSQARTLWYRAKEGRPF